MSKVFVLGIDGAPPEYVFGEWLDDLPNIKKLMSEGFHAKLNSTIPPLSGVAWTTITTGKHPADTGIFEYIYRKNYSYHDYHVVTSMNIKEKTIWQIASEHGKKSNVCYPLLAWPVKPFNGNLICGILTPPDAKGLTHPESLKNEIDEMLGEPHQTDIPDFRKLNKNQVIEQAYKVTKMHFKSIRYLIKKGNWDLFFSIIYGSDRLNHMFWRYLDKEHRKHIPNSEFSNVLKDYYQYIDKEIGETLELLDKDTKIIIMSDHGVFRIHNRVNLADWLIRNNYMKLKNPISEKTEFSSDLVDWKQTKAFAIGAYEGQININLIGREPDGCVKQEDYDSLLKELEEKIKEIPGDDGVKLNTKFFRKKDHFIGKRNYLAPDLLIYFDDLQYGCNVSLIGNDTLWSPSTALGSDDAGHSKQGIFIIKNNKDFSKEMGEINAIDVAPTILKELNIEIPNEMPGKVIP